MHTTLAPSGAPSGASSGASSGTNFEFHALLMPHRSLPKKGFLVLMGVLAAAWGGVGIYFVHLGAWHVFGFFGLDFALVWWLFRRNYRDGLAREEVSITRQELCLEKTNPYGRTSAHRFNTFWAKFDVTKTDGIGITDMAIRSKTMRVRFGSFLNADEKESFAKAFQSALATAKR